MEHLHLAAVLVRHVHVERALVIAQTNFQTDLETLVAAKGLAFRRETTETDVNTHVVIYDRLQAEIFLDQRDPDLPGLGIYGLQNRTQARWQGRRDNDVTVVLDYAAIGTDPVLLAKQVELAAEACLLLIDRLPEGAPQATGSIGAGEEDRAIIQDISGVGRRADTSDWYADRVITQYLHREQDLV